LTGSRGADLYIISLQEMSKAKRSSFMTKAVPSSKGRLNLLHMDLCGPMRVASINGKKYILVIVDDYSRYTWTLFLRSKDETPETLHAYFKEEGIEHQTSTPRTPEQNGVVERRNRTLVEATRTMLSAFKLPLSFWAEAVLVFKPSCMSMSLRANSPRVSFKELYENTNQEWKWCLLKITLQAPSGLVLHQMTSEHNCSELGIQDHSNDPSSSKLVPKVVLLADKTATSRQYALLLESSSDFRWPTAAHKSLFPILSDGRENGISNGSTEGGDADHADALNSPKKALLEGIQFLVINFKLDDKETKLQLQCLQQSEYVALSACYSSKVDEDTASQDLWLQTTTKYRLDCELSSHSKHMQPRTSFGQNAHPNTVSIS
ncbi:retrovirus-related pol polyprotein from transposon TNT 1-94, partial [Tanacetum coccineum]